MTKPLLHTISVLVANKPGVLVRIALVFARTDTKWFQATAKHTSLMLFPAGRISFCRADGSPAEGNAGAPSVFMAFGDLARDRLRNSGIAGTFLGTLD